MDEDPRSYKLTFVQMQLVKQCADAIIEMSGGSFRDLMMMNDLIAGLLIRTVCTNETMVERIADIHADHIKLVFDEQKETMQ